ncbi:hypothetical protein NAF17_03675 [Mucilaginibacter sp. RB4R14]|uniref:hypothetical protein n=1 Tax=Mucilaginibacter aurantiaciroseus TaxID=2949308 RepID=UPI002091DECE|nr:hypothetical protein [Mucilaginibacter aurantiaciroseus]MCO5934630.1 hypothetical protein [Mucilaginibacter aurantiaciroseus]
MKPAESIYRKIVPPPFPLYVCTGEEMIITVANTATLKAWDRDNICYWQAFF